MASSVKEHDVHSICKAMQKEIGPAPICRVETFTNWSKLQRISNLITCTPTTLQHVQAVIKAATRLNLRVRCTGAGHSWAPLFPDEGNVLVRVHELTRHDGPRIELIKKDGKNYVTVSSGVTVKELEDFELEHKVNFPCNIILCAPMYGGVISAGCHGTGWDFKALPDYVTRMRIVVSNGRLRTFSDNDDPNDRDSCPLLFKAVQTNLGMFGIIYDITFVLPDLEIVKSVNDFKEKVGDLLYDPQKLKDVVLDNTTTEIFWFPFNSHTLPNKKVIDAFHHSIGHDKHALLKLKRKHWNPERDNLWVKKVNIASKLEHKQKEGECYYKFLDWKNWVEATGTKMSSWLLHFVPFFTPVYSRDAFHYLKHNTSQHKIVQALPHAIHYRSHIPIMKVHDFECCFSIINEDFSVVTKACKAVIDIVEEDARKGEYPLNVAMEMRFMADSDSYLCPAYIGSDENGGTGHTFYLEVLSFTSIGEKEWQTFCNKVFQKWKELDPTIHWAKEWRLLDGGLAYMKQRYKTQGEKFVKQLKKAEVDPYGMFRNDTLDEIFFSKGCQENE